MADALKVDNARPLVAWVTSLPAEWTSSTQRLILLLLAADIFPDRDTTRPSESSLLAWSGLSRSTMYDALKALQRPVPGVRPALVDRVDQQGLPLGDRPAIRNKATGYRLLVDVLESGEPDPNGPTGSGQPDPNSTTGSGEPDPNGRDGVRSAGPEHPLGSGTGSGTGSGQPDPPYPSLPSGGHHPAHVQTAHEEQGADDDGGLRDEETARPRAGLHAKLDRILQRVESA